jgi:CheY-like chemotaxis protein
MARRLLLADDSITIQKVVELVLAEEDFEIQSVSNGEDALNIIENFRPDVVLADIEMPKLNGYQLCDRIKKNPSISHIPVILLAGAFEPIDEELSLSVGADDSVIKPFESQELISKINAALTMSSVGSSAEQFFSLTEEPDTETEELIEVAEDAAGTVETDEPLEVAGLDDDLWAMEEVPDTLEELGSIAELAEAEGLDETFETAQAAEVSMAPAAVETSVQSRVVKEVMMPEIAVPSKEELKAVFEETVRESVAEFLSSLDIREALLASLAPAMKESAEKVLWEIAPELAEKMLKEILTGSIASLTAQVEKVIWETVPDLAGTMISKEIEKIKADF